MTKLQKSARSITLSVGLSVCPSDSALKHFQLISLELQPNNQVSKQTSKHTGKHGKPYIFRTTGLQGQNFFLQKCKHLIKQASKHASNKVSNQSIKQ